MAGDDVELGKRALGRSFRSHVPDQRGAGQYRPIDSRLGEAFAQHFCHWVENDLWLGNRPWRVETIAAAEQAGNRRMIGFATLAPGLGRSIPETSPPAFATLRSVLSPSRTCPMRASLPARRWVLCAGADRSGCGTASARGAGPGCGMLRPAAAHRAGCGDGAHQLGAHLGGGVLFAEAETHARKAISILRVEPVLSCRVCGACEDPAAGTKNRGAQRGRETVWQCLLHWTAIPLRSWSCVWFWLKPGRPMAIPRAQSKRSGGAGRAWLGMEKIPGPGDAHAPSGPGSHPCPGPASGAKKWFGRRRRSLLGV